jgi:hypothetical protein
MIDRRIMIYDFRDGREGYLDDLAIGHFQLQARSGQGLRCFHAADDAAHAIAVSGNDLYVVMTVERLQCCEGFGDFHYLFTALSLYFCFDDDDEPQTRTIAATSVPCRVRSLFARVLAAYTQWLVLLSRARQHPRRLKYARTFPNGFNPRAR